MKQITNKTALKQGDKTYQPVEIDGVIYWVKDYNTADENFYAILNGDIEFIYRSKYSGTYLVVKDGSTMYSHKIKSIYKIVAQSQPKLNGIPVVSLDSYLDLRFKNETTTWSWGESGSRIPEEFYKKGFKSNPNHYTQADIEKAIELARKHDVDLHNGRGCTLIPQISRNEILQQINSISVIEVDEQFNILGYG